VSRKGWLILLTSVLVPGFLFLGLVVTFSSRNLPRPIPDGVYRASVGADLVAIEGRRIRFVVQGRDPGPTGAVVKECDDTVYPDGSIVAYPMTSAELFSGPVYGRYDWSWDGQVITRREIERPGRKRSDLSPPIAFTRSARP
jgi:hypothetical protein